MRVLSFLFLASCGVTFGDQGSKQQTVDAGAAKDATADAPAIVGVACGQDRTTGAKLCSGVSACPMLFVDPEALPGCGFVTNGMEIQCLCVDELCTLGKPKSCQEARAMLQSANVLTVCAQVGEGTCKPAK